MDRVHVVGHPLVLRDLAVLRGHDTGRVAFRAAMRRIARILAMRAFESLRHRDVEVRTPLETTRGTVLDESVALVPVLRAGLGLVDGFLDVMPEVKVCHVGMVRDEATHQPTAYLSKLDRLAPKDRVFVVDPMLATGGSAVATFDLLRRHGYAHAALICVIAAPEGLARLHQAHPETQVWTTAVDRELDAQAFIRPGLGDAGDRLFDA